MLIRNLQEKLSWLLKQFPVVAILGARQVGKTTYKSVEKICSPYPILLTSITYLLVS